MRRWQSGQLHHTVNVTPSGYVGSNPTLRTKKMSRTDTFGDYCFVDVG
jgi:hypothetical protein